MQPDYKVMICFGLGHRADPVQATSIFSENLENLKKSTHKDGKLSFCLNM